VAARSKAYVNLYRSKTGIMGSNPSRGTDICGRFTALCYPLEVQALR
jgi:hypothetical protein